MWWEEWLMAKPPGSLGRQSAQASQLSRPAEGDPEAQVGSGHLPPVHGLSLSLSKEGTEAVRGRG